MEAKRIVLHPMDEKIAVKIAAQVPAMIMLSKNTNPTQIRLFGFSEKEQQLAANLASGWTIINVSAWS